MIPNGLGSCLGSHHQRHTILIVRYFDKALYTGCLVQEMSADAASTGVRKSPRHSGRTEGGNQ